jgi:uncharacterized protein with ParB-like and HNH nuclease domain
MDAKAVYLHQVLEGEKQYIVPVFQRYYSWFEKHWSALWEDIETLEETAGLKEHFLGALVCMADKHTPYATPRYIIIDGQQRLSTLSILLCAIRDVASAFAVTCATEDKVSAEKFCDLAKEVEKKYLIDEFKADLERYKIVSRSKDRALLLDLIRGKCPSGENNIALAYKYFKNKIENHMSSRNNSEQSLRKLFNITTKQLSLVMITLDSGENPFVIFETLNFRGLKLEESDLIRNFVFMQLPLENQDKFDNNLWAPFEAMLAKVEDKFEAISLSGFYRDYLMVNGSYVKKDEIYLKFRNTVKRKKKTLNHWLTV